MDCAWGVGRLDCGDRIVHGGEIYTPIAVIDILKKRWRKNAGRVFRGQQKTRLSGFSVLDGCLFEGLVAGVGFEPTTFGL
jgi:hypothetical protein